MAEREGRSGGELERDDDREMRELLERAGPRPEIPEADLEAIVTSARAEWQARWESEPRREAWWRSRGAAAGLAAALALAVGLGWWWQGLRGGGAPAVVAQVEVVSGPVRLAAGGGEGRPLAAGEPVPAGAVVATGGATEREGRVSLRLATGTTVRLDSASRLRLASASILELERGAVYLDTGTAERPGAPLEVRTALGTARDLGTQFSVRLVGADARALGVRVREGRVEVVRRGRTYVAGAGDELVLRREGPLERRRVPGYGPAWEWAMDAAPGFDLEGRTLRELLDWVSRETGWRILYEDPELSAAAEEIVLHGSLGDLDPDQAPFAVLPGAGLEGELRQGVLVVRRP
ncbi:MAG TPA: FecR domain-containing protein [Thermoanaerobaculia bacterium]|nr:FecR domain-containing protein [Thermoanaerobaculia bacterium]